MRSSPVGLPLVLLSTLALACADSTGSGDDLGDTGATGDPQGEDGGDDGGDGGDDGDDGGPGDGGDDGDTGGSGDAGDDGDTDDSGDDGDEGDDGGPPDGPPPEGNEVWRWRVPNSEARAVDVGGGLVYVAARNGMIYGLDKDSGQEAWSFSTGSLTTSNTNLYTEEHLFVAANTGAIALDPATGSEQWRISGNPGEITTDGTHIYFLDLDRDTVMSVLIADQSVTWSTPVGEGAHVPGRVSVAGDVACGQLYSGGVFCLDIETGEGLWSVNHEGTFVSAALSADGGVLFTRSKTDAIRALDTTNGDVIWENAPPPLGSEEGSGIVRSGDKLAYSDTNTLTVLNTADGANLWTKPIPGFNSGAEPVFGSGLVFFVSNEMLAFGPTPTNMRTMAFDVASGNKLWEREVDDSALSANVAGTPAYEGSSLYVAAGAVVARFD